MFSTFDVYIAEASDENLERDLLKRFIVTYLTQDDLDKLKMILTNIPQLRPFWRKTAHTWNCSIKKALKSYCFPIVLTNGC